MLFRKVYGIHSESAVEAPAYDRRAAGSFAGEYARQQELLRQMRAAESQLSAQIAQGAQEGGKAENETCSEVVIRPDGSRVLVITTQIGGQVMRQTIRLSDPTAPGAAAAITPAAEALAMLGGE